MKKYEIKKLENLNFEHFFVFFNAYIKNNPDPSDLLTLNQICHFED